MAVATERAASAVPVGGDGSPVVGSITPKSFVVFVRRLVATVRNWPSVLTRLVLASARIRLGDITTRLRNGVVIVSPASRPAWWPTFEMFAEDVYRVCDLGDVSLSPGDVILDLGAHIGTAAVLLSRRWPNATLVCVEPNPQTFSYLQRNLTANAVQAQSVNAAIGVADGTTTLFGADGASCEASTSFEVGGTSRQVAVAGFERVVREAPGPVRIVKLDCEGAEHDVLAASTPELWADVQVVLLEYHRTSDPASTWEATEGRFHKLGFETVWETPFPWYPGLGMATLRRPRA